MSDRPRTPAGLGARGARLWRETLSDYQLRADELATLLEACRTVDALDRIEAELAGAGLTVPGSTPGSLRPHPLLGEARGLRQVLAQLLRLLGLADVAEPDDDGQPRQLTPKQARAQHAARVRWDRQQDANARRRERRRGDAAG